MKINGEHTNSEKLISLDQVIHMIFDKAEIAQNPPVFDFMKVHDRKVMEEIKKYTRAVKDADFNGTAGPGSDGILDDVVESLSSGLTDAVLASGLAYFENGMKFGARLLLELIG